MQHKLKPMLAGSIEKVERLSYPVLVTPKLDGIRCLTVRHGERTMAVSRKLKPIPNKYVRTTINTMLPAGLDGELMLRPVEPSSHSEPRTDFGAVSSSFMRQSGKPDFIYHVFDVHNVQDAYIERLAAMAKIVDVAPEWVKGLVPEMIHTPEELLAYESRMLEAGYEGVMIRDPYGPYKHGRSTVREGYLLKLKRFLDAEARVVGVIEELHNANEATVDNLGRTERSSHKANKHGKGSMGALRVEPIGATFPDVEEFKIGTGFSAKQRADFWADREEILGRIVKFKYQPVGAKEAPRFPSFLGFRHEDDM